MTQNESKSAPAPAFKVGDMVHYFNGNGFYLGIRKVIEIAPVREPWESWMEQRYYIAPTDTPWFPVPESQFVSLADMPVTPPVGYQRKERT